MDNLVSQKPDFSSTNVSQIRSHETDKSDAVFSLERYGPDQSRRQVSSRKASVTIIFTADVLDVFAMPRY